MPNVSEATLLKNRMQNKFVTTFKDLDKVRVIAALKLDYA